MENIIYHYDDRLVGFGSNITVAFSTIKHCVKNNLKCSVNIKNHLYGSNEQNIWDIFLEQPFQINDFDYSKATDPFKLNCWEYPSMEVALQKLRNNDHIAEFQGIYSKYFIPKKVIIDPIDKFLSGFKNKKILGLHRRGRDQLSIGHGSGQKDKLSENYLFSFIDKEIDNYDYLYITSDESTIYKSFEKRYKNKVIFLDAKTEYEDNDIGLHYLTNNLTVEKKNFNLKIMLLETIILSKCDKMFLVNSNVSQLALFLSNHLNYNFYDSHVFYHN